MQEIPTDNPETLDSFRELINQELLNQSQEYGIDDIKELFDLLWHELDFAEGEVQEEIFGLYLENKMSEASMEENLAAAIEVFVEQYVVTLAGIYREEPLIHKEKTVESAETIDPEWLMISPEIIEEIESKGIMPHDLSILSVESSKLRINTGYLAGVEKIGKVQTATVELDVFKLEDLEKTSGREEMLKILATVILWEQTHQKKIKITGVIL